MREESHLDEMRTAIRGDFERLAERRGEQDLMRVADEEDSAAGVEAHEPETTHETPGAEAEELSAPDAEPEPRSWLARLFSPP